MFAAALLLLLSADLSTYRQFQFGMELPAALKVANLTATDAKTVTERPALIQTVEWQPRRMSNPDSVESVDLTFFNNQLFRIVVNYQRLRTEGLTTADMADSISTLYGPATHPKGEIILPSYNDEATPILARWEDDGYTYSLVHSFMSSFALIAESKALRTPALAAIGASHKMDLDEFPANELVRNRKEAVAAKTALEQARASNKAGFKP